MISFSAIFFALSETSPVTGAFYRMAYALPVLLLLWVTRRRGDHRPAARRWFAFVAGIALGIDVFAWHSAIDFIGTGLATLLANTQVIFVAVGAWILLGERPRRTTMLTIPVILLGVFLVSGAGQGDAFGDSPVKGTLLALVAAIFYAGFILGYRHSNNDHAPPAGPLMEATAGALLATLVIGLLGPGVDFGIEWPSHGWLLLLALSAQVAGWLLIGFALPRLPAVETATIVLLQPALTMVWGTVIFTERPSTLQLVGALLIFLGVGFVAAMRARTTAQPGMAR